MTRKQDIGEIVARSMQEILDSDEHQRLFNKTAAKKKCCACEGKCARKCPCKTDGGCKKNCGPCDSVSKKASEDKKCCDCASGCGVKCPCSQKEKGSCQDCSACGDGKMSTEASVEMVQSLLEISAKQDELGLFKSAEQSLKAATALMREIQKKANADENEVSTLDAFEVDPDDAYDSLTEEDSSTPSVDAVLEQILKEHPDFFKQMKRRRNEGEPVENTFDLDAILGPETDRVPSEKGMLPGSPELFSDEELDSALLPVSQTMLAGDDAPKTQHNGLTPGKLPPSQEELDDLAQQELDSGRNIYKMYEEQPDYSGMPETWHPKSRGQDEDETLSMAALETLVTKFAFEAEAEDDVDFRDLFPASKSHPLDEMMDSILEEGDVSDADDFEEEDDELAFARDIAKRVKEDAEGVDLETVAEARDSLERAFDAELSKEKLDMDKANELHKLHGSLVNYLKSRGHEQPGKFLDEEDQELGGDSEDPLMDAYMSMLAPEQDAMRASV